MILFPLNILRVEWKNPRKKFEKIRNFTVEISQSCDQASCRALFICLKLRKARRSLSIRTSSNTITTTLPLFLTTGSAPTRAATHASQQKRNLTYCLEMIYLSTNTATKLWKGLFVTRKTKLSNGWLWFLKQLLNRFL